MRRCTNIFIAKRCVLCGHSCVCVCVWSQGKDSCDCKQCGHYVFISDFMCSYMSVQVGIYQSGYEVCCYMFIANFYVDV